MGHEKLLVIVIATFFLLIPLSIHAMTTDSYYAYDYYSSSPFSNPDILGPTSIELDWPDAPGEDSNIIHQVNLSIHYKPTPYESSPNKDTCKIFNNVYEPVILFARNLSVGGWAPVYSSSSITLFNGDITRYIDKNDYRIKLEVQGSDAAATCVVVGSALLKVNYTETGTAQIDSYSSVPPIPAGQTTTVNFTITCNDGYCGQMTYDLFSSDPYVLQTQNTVVSTKYLGENETENSETIEMEITGINPGQSDIFLEATGSYGGRSLGFLGKSWNIPVTVTDGSNPSGELVIESVSILPIDPIINPIPRGSDVTVRANVSCNNGNCGDISYTLTSSGLPILSFPDITCVIDDGESCLFEWVLSSDISMTGDEYTVYLLFESYETGVGPVETTKTLLFTDPLPTTTDIQIDIEHPKRTLFNVSDQFELSASINCQGDCVGIQYYALYNNVTSGLKKISYDTPIYFSDGAQINPIVDYPVWLAKWNIKAAEPGIYDLSIKAVDGQTMIALATIEHIIILYPEDEPIKIDDNTTIMVEENIELEITSPTSSQTLKRGDILDFKIKVFRDGSFCTNCIVEVTSPLMESDIFLDYENGYYMGTGRISDVAEGLKTIQIKVNGKLKEEIDMLVEPELNFTGSTDKTIYNVFDVIKITGVTEKNAYVSAELTCGDKYKKKPINLQADGLGAYLIDNLVISKDVPAGWCSVKIDVTDKYNNRGEKSLDIRINPSEMNTYNLGITSPLPSIGKITKGEKVSIIVKVTQNNKDIRDMRVNCTDINGDDMTLGQYVDDKGNVFYKREYNTPLHYNKTEWVLACIAEKNGEYGTNSIILQLEGAGMIIKVLEPSPYEQLQPGQTVKIKVRSEYSNGAPANAATIRMMINGEDEIILKRGIEPGTYVGTFDTGEKEIVSFDFSASDNEGVSGGLDSFLLTVKNPDIGDYLFYIAGAVILIVVAFSVVVIYARKGKTTVITKTEKIDMEEVEEKVKQKHMTDRRFVIKEKLRDLQLEYENLENDIDMLHSEYFKREIDEETFVKLLQERKERKENIASTMKGLTKELKELEGQENKNMEENGNYENQNEGTA